jgi:hypothetical protein
VRCWNCAGSLDGLETGHCPGCGAWFSTGAEIVPLRHRLQCRAGPRRCTVCKRDLTGTSGDRCPECSSRFSRAVKADLFAGDLVGGV